MTSSNRPDVGTADIWTHTTRTHSEQFQLEEVRYTNVCEPHQNYTQRADGGSSPQPSASPRVAHQRGLTPCNCILAVFWLYGNRHG